MTDNPNPKTPGKSSGKSPGKSPVPSNTTVPQADGSDGSDDAVKRTPAEIEAEIEQTREDLADTVDQLGTKLAQTKQTTVKTATVVGVTAAVVIVAVVVVRRVRSHR